MSKKFVATLLAVVFLGGGAVTFPVDRKEVSAVGDTDGIVVAVEDTFEHLSIIQQTEQSDLVDWVYKMTYDRLLEFDRDGKLM